MVGSDIHVETRLNQDLQHVQFAMNRHQMSNGVRSEGPPQTSGSVDGEKCNILPPRPKRSSLGPDPLLPNIQESADEHVRSRREHRNSRVDREERRWQKSEFHSFSEEKIQPERNGQFNSGSDNSQQGSHGPARECMDKIQEERHNNTPEMRPGSGVDITSTATNTPDFENRIQYVQSTRIGQNENVVPDLDLGNNENRCKKMDVKSNGSSSSSTKSWQKDSDLKREPDWQGELREVKCKHQATTACLHNQEEQLNKILKVQRSSDADPDKCVICKITEATAKFASVESNRVLLELVYPHEFYDKYSRSSKKVHNYPTDTKDSFTISKPVKVIRKPRRERTFIQPVLSERRDPPIVPPEPQRDVYPELSPEKKRRRELTETSIKKEVHPQCQTRSNAMVITDETEGQRMVLKGLKGWILKKDDVCKDRLHRDTKQSLYQVNTLGMQFSIPEYNRALTFRKPSSPRDTFGITTPRPLERSYTQLSRGIQLGTSSRGEKARDTFNYQREGTNHSTPKLFSRSLTEGTINYGSCNQTLGNVSYSSGSSKRTSSIPESGTTLHLPPIHTDVKQAVVSGKHHS